MTDLTKFLIFIPTYNRNDLVNEAIESVLNQTFHDFILYVSDNSSDIPIVDTVPSKYRSDPRLVIVRQERFYATGVEHFDSVIKVLVDNYNFDMFLSLADDDCLVKNALEVVSSEARKYRYIACNYITYEQLSNRAQYNYYCEPKYEWSTQEKIKYHARMAGVRFDSDSGSCFNTEDYRKFSVDTHVSGIFIGGEVLRSVLSKYGKISVEPFGDVGYGLLAAEVDIMAFLSSPLLVVRIFSNYGVVASAPGNRFFLNKHHTLCFDKSVVKSISFSNASLLAYMNLLEKLGYGYKKMPSVHFFVRHMREIALDKPFTRASVRDLWESLLYLIRPLNFLCLIKFSLFRRFVSRKKVHSVQVENVSEIQLLLNSQIYKERE